MRNLDLERGEFLERGVVCVRGVVDSVSATAITVKPKDGSANQTCTVKNADDVKRIEKDDQVEMTCVQIAGVWTLEQVRERR